MMTQLVEWQGRYALSLYHTLYNIFSFYCCQDNIRRTASLFLAGVSGAMAQPGASKRC